MVQKPVRSASYLEILRKRIMRYISRYVDIKRACDQKNSTNHFIELAKGQIHSSNTWTVFAMIESPKFHQITKKYKYNIEKRKDRLASRSTAYFFRNTDKRYPFVTTAAAQQQLSSSTAAAAAAQQEQ